MLPPVRCHALYGGGNFPLELSLVSIGRSREFAGDAAQLAHLCTISGTWAFAQPLPADAANSPLGLHGTPNVPQGRQA